MIGDNPYVIGVVIVALAGFLWLKFGNRRDPRRCPQCQSIVLSLAGDDAFVCHRCATALRRDSNGTVHRRG